MKDAASPTPQRARGVVRVGFRAEGGETRLKDLYQSGSAKGMLPRVHGGPPQVVLVNTAGGVTGGDRFDYALAVGAGAEAIATTQTAERIYRAASGAGRIETELTLGEGARLDWLPQETILFDGGALDRRLTVEMSGTARLLVCEAVVLGRTAMGETVRGGHFTDQWRIRRDGRLCLAEATRLGGDIETLRQTPASLNGARAFATLAYVAPDAEARLDQARAILATLPDLEAAASAWHGQLVLRCNAKKSVHLRDGLLTFLRIWRAESVPRVWHM
ncbi:MAG: urease accessory protein UreD [Pseudomonadota bacterium]